MKLANIKIATRLGVFTGLLMLTILAVGLYGSLRLRESNDHLTQALHNTALLEASVDQARSAQVQFKIQVQEWKNLLLRGHDPAAFEKYQTEFKRKSDETQTELKKLQGTLKELGLNPAWVDDALSSHLALGGAYLEAAQKYVPADASSPQLVDGLVKGMDREPTKKMDAIVAKVLAQSDQLHTQYAHDAAGSYHAAMLSLAIFVALVILTGAAVTYWIVKSITTPLNRAVTLAKTVASGDLTSVIEVTGTDETGQLLTALRAMNANLLGIVGEVRISSDTMATASNQIAAANMDLSTRTEQQAASLEETAASMEQLTATVRQNSDNAHNANQLAVSASNTASKGLEAIGRVAETMESINGSSRKILDIIAVIDGIAFQTNILALNAAVEAARAGDQGRGFAVVASEVRNLAHRSATAAKEIKVLIGASVDVVEAGGQLVKDACLTIEAVAHDSKRVADTVSEIASASHQQTEGLEQINIAVSQMDQVTQENAAMVEEAAAAAASMQNQVSILLQAVGMFKLTHQGVARLAGPAKVH